MRADREDHFKVTQARSRNSKTHQENTDFSLIFVINNLRDWKLSLMNAFSLKKTLTHAGWGSKRDALICWMVVFNTTIEKTNIDISFLNKGHE